MLAKDFHDATVRRLVFIDWRCLGDPDAIGNFKQSIKPVRRRLVWSNNPEVTFIQVEFHNVSQKAPENARCLCVNSSGSWNCHGVIAIVWQLQILEEQTAIRMRVGAHAALALRRQFGKFRSQLSCLVKQFLGLIAPQPLFQHSQVLRILCGLRQWDLMRTKCSLDRFAIDELWPGPTLRRAENNHGPLRASSTITLARISLNRSNLVKDRIESGRHQLMHCCGFVTFNEMRSIPV